MRQTIKRIFLIMIMTLVLTPTFAHDHSYYEKLINAIAYVESKYNEKIVSADKKHVGYLQISRITVDEANRLIKKKSFTYNDRYSKEKSIEMFLIIQNHYNPEGDIVKAIRTWNEGPFYNRKIATTKYLRKVYAVYEKIIAEE